MTPFKIRKRIGSYLRQRRREQAGPIEQFDVTFILPDGSRHQVQAERHYTLVMASQTLETPIHTGCPDGRCGDCQVVILNGGSSISVPTEAERDVMDATMGKDRDPSVRLACHARVMGPGLEVRVQKVWRLEDIRGGEV